MAKDPDRLEQRVVTLATEMFARDTGFSGPQLHELSAAYTDVLGSYGSGGSESRWQLFQRGLSSMAPADQRRFLLELCTYEGWRKYPPPSDQDVARLRSWLGDLTPGAHETVARLEELDWKTVSKSWAAATEKVTDDPDGAITATRTTLESVCKHICDERNAHYEDAWDLAKLYKAAAGAMDIAPDRHNEQIIKQILSGVTTVVAGLAAMRNSLSDAHGRGKAAVGPAPRHARLAVNAGFAVAAFLIDTHVEKAQNAEGRGAPPAERR